DAFNSGTRANSVSRSPGLKSPRSSISRSVRTTRSVCVRDSEVNSHSRDFSALSALLTARGAPPPLALARGRRYRVASLRPLARAAGAFSLLPFPPHLFGNLRDPFQLLLLFVSRQPI